MKERYNRFFESSYIEDSFGFSKEDFAKLSSSEFNKLNTLLKRQDALMDKFMEDPEAYWVGDYEDQSGSYDDVQGFYASEEFLLKLLKKQKKTPKIENLLKIVSDITTLLKKVV